MEFHHRVVEFSPTLLAKWKRKGDTDNNLNSGSDFSGQSIQWAFVPEWTSLACSLSQEADPCVLDHPAFFASRLVVKFAGQLAEGKGQSIFAHSPFWCLSSSCMCVFTIYCCKPLKQLYPAPSTRFPPFVLGVRHDNHFLVYLVSLSLGPYHLFLFPYLSLHLCNLSFC